MRIKKTLFGIMMVAALLILARPSISSADTYSGAWLPNGSDIFMIELTPTSGTASFYMYDWGDTNDSLSLITDGVNDSDTAYFTNVSGTWYAGLTSGATTLNLGSTQEFGFYFYDAGNTYTSYDLITLEQGVSYRLSDSSNTGMEVFVTRAAPVPIPASVLLLGSGILGLITIGRVKRKDS